MFLEMKKKYNSTLYLHVHPKKEIFTIWLWQIQDTLLKHMMHKREKN